MDLKQLKPSEQELVKKLLSFRLRVENTSIYLKDICSQIELVVSEEKPFDKVRFGINELENNKTSLEIEADKTRALMSEYPEGHEEYRILLKKLIRINGLIYSIKSAIAEGGIVKSARLGAFFGNYQTKTMGSVINRGPHLFLYRNNIIDAAKKNGTTEETVLVKTFIHEMFHAWNYFACEKRERTVREIDEAMVEFATLYFLEQITEKHPVFESILEWAEESIRKMQTAIGLVAAYGYGYYLYSLSKTNKRVIQILKNYPYKSGVIDIKSNFVVQVKEKLRSIYPYREENEVFDLLYKIVCPKVIAHVWKNDQVLDVLKDEEKSDAENYLTETNISGFYLNDKLLRVVNSGNAYSIEFKYNKKWWPLYDNLFKKVVLFDDFVFAVTCSGNINIILHLRHIKKNLSLCKNDMSCFKEMIRKETLKTDKHIFNSDCGVGFQAFLRVERGDKYNYFSYKHHKSRDLYFKIDFDACANPKPYYDQWLFRVILGDRCQILNERKRNVSRNHKELLTSWESESLNKIKKGDAAAMYSWGEACQHGSFVVKNEEKAIEWYSKAAEKGHKEAQYCLGKAFYDGCVVKQNYQEALKWFQNAAEQGHAESQYYLGEMYYHGYGIEKDDHKAVAQYIKAHRRGCSKALCSLKKMAEEGDLTAIDWCHRYNVREDAEKQYKKAEELYNLGEQYRKGWKVFKDEEAAAKCFHEAAKMGHFNALNNLKKLANDGYVRARFQLGEMYLNGEGVEKDVAVAIEWYSKAVKKQYSMAADRLKQLAEEGHVEAITALRQLAEKDKVLAIELLKRLAEHGNVEAQYNLGVFFQKKKLNEEAKNCFFQAMLRGHFEAKEAYCSIISCNDEDE